MRPECLRPLPLATALALVLALPASAACTRATPASAKPPAGTLVHRVNESVACTLQLDQDPQKCASKQGCALQPELHCSGAEPPPGLVDGWRKAAADGTAPCQCVCAEDQEHCSQVP
ncbi:MAG: hypothetical protein IT373_33180 [Polyangiaceae bacterium]|nr:hypothetical protein [Polyangiaceae bacterium]